MTVGSRGLFLKQAAHSEALTDGHRQLEDKEERLQEASRQLQALNKTEARQRLELGRLQQELAKAQEASRQLAASYRAEAVAAAEEIARLERELSAVRAAHGKAVERSNQVYFDHYTRPACILLGGMHPWKKSIACRLLCAPNTVCYR